MAFDKLKRKLADTASDAAERVRDSDAVRRAADSRAGREVKQRAADQVAKLGPRLRELVLMDDERPMSPEKLLLMLVGAVDADDEVALSLDDVRGTGRRNERLAAAAGILGGGPGCFVADMYADAALFCLLDESFELGLADEAIAAHLLVAWNVVADLHTAGRCMDAADPTTVADLTSDRLEIARSEIRTKRDAIRALWRLRSGLSDMPLFDPSTFVDLLLAGRALQQRLDEAAMHLGIPATAVAKPGRLRRRRRRRSPGG